MVTRHDLADRCIFLNFPPIRDDHRITEKELTSLFGKLSSRILGGILNVICTALHNIETTTLEEIPRMADFALWVQAAEPDLPWASGGFLKAYNQNRKDVIGLALEADMVATAIRELMSNTDSWKGTASELLDDLEKNMPEKDIRRREWPKSPAALSRRLTRAASFLRRDGIAVERHDPKGRSRTITLERIRSEKSVHPVQSVQESDSDDLDPDGIEDNVSHTDSSCVHMDGKDFNVAQQKGEEFQEDYNMDDMDGRNDQESTLANGPTPKRCGDCANYSVEPGWIGCKVADEKLKNLESCPLKGG
jgi:hypothetical protein